MKLLQIFAPTKKSLGKKRDDGITYLEKYSHVLLERSKKVVKPDLKPYGEWNPAKRNEVRAFFENIAKKRKLDPLVPKTWYNLTAQSVVQKVHNTTFIFYFNFAILHQFVDLICVDFRKRRKGGKGATREQELESKQLEEREA
jgi:hypothetical protein